MNAQDIINLESRYIVQTYKRAPFVIEYGEGVWLYDSEGNRYLDLVGGIAVNALGYGDPEILDAINEQAHKLLHVSNLYHTRPHVELAQLLCENSFADRVFFCNSGAEANEGAMKFARKWARENYGEGKTEFVAFTGAFHGRTFGTLTLTPRESYQAPFRPLLPGVTIAEFNNLDSAAQAITDQTCAVLVEPIQGEGGVNPATPGFLSGLRELCHAHRALLIFDEVQCGLGRTGYLWAHEFYGVRPDIMTLAKPLGGGLPIAAILVIEAVGMAMKPGDHGSTFAANPLICHVAKIIVNRVRQPEFLAAVREKGEYLMARLADLGSPRITEIRGRGLMIGLQLDVLANPIVQKGYAEGLILVNAGDQVLRLVPPLIIEKEHIDLLVEKLGKILATAQ